MTGGEVGCAISHVKAWKQALDMNLSFAIFFEDDAEILPGVHKQIETVVAKYLMNNTFEFLYLGRKRLIANEIEEVVDEELQLVYPGFSWWMLAYVVTREGLQHLLKDSFYQRNMIVLDEYVPAMIAVRIVFSYLLCVCVHLFFVFFFVFVCVIVFGVDFCTCAR